MIFKHAQKKIIEKELEYQKQRIQYLKDKNMTKFKDLVRRATIEYRQIEQYVTEKACWIMKLEVENYHLSFTRALQQPSMLMKIRGSDESFRRRMWKRIYSDRSVLEKMSETQKKDIYLELLELQHQCELTCLGFDSWESGREELRVNLIAE